MTRALLALLLPLSAAAHEPVSLDAGTRTLCDAPWLHLTGQKVLPEEVYRSILELPPDAGLDTPTAQLVHDQIEAYLQLTGYELGNAEVHVTDGGMDVSIDEGQLEKVVFRGRQSLDTIRFKLALDIPHDVFNRPEIERQMKKLEQTLGITGMRMVLVPSTSVK